MHFVDIFTTKQSPSSPLSCPKWVCLYYKEKIISQLRVDNAAETIPWSRWFIFHFSDMITVGHLRFCSMSSQYVSQNEGAALMSVLRWKEKCPGWILQWVLKLLLDVTYVTSVYIPFTKGKQWPRLTPRGPCGELLLPPNALTLIAMGRDGGTFSRESSKWLQIIIQPTTRA